MPISISLPSINYPGIYYGTGAGTAYHRIYDPIAIPSSLNPPPGLYPVPLTDPVFSSGSTLAVQAVYVCKEDIEFILGTASPAIIPYTVTQVTPKTPYCTKVDDYIIGTVGVTPIPSIPTDADISPYCDLKLYHDATIAVGIRTINNPGSLAAPRSDVCAPGQMDYQFRERAVLSYQELEPLPEPDFLADIVLNLPARSERDLGRIYFVAHPTNPNYMTIYRVYRNTVRRTKRTITPEDIFTEVAKISYSKPIPHLSNISSRDSYITNLVVNTIISVEDARDDPTVISGGAIYFYNADTDQVSKIIEYDYRDGPLYRELLNGTVALGEDIDQMNFDSHSHRSLLALDKVRDIDGVLHSDTLPILELGFWQEVSW